MPRRATCSAPSTASTLRRLVLCACALLHYYSPFAATHEAMLKASPSPTVVSRGQPSCPPPDPRQHNPTSGHFASYLSPQGCRTQGRTAHLLRFRPRLLQGTGMVPTLAAALSPELHRLP